MARTAFILSLCSWLLIVLLVVTLPARMPPVAYPHTVALGLSAFFIPPVAIVLSIIACFTDKRSSSYSLAAIIISLVAWYVAAFVTEFYC